MKRAALTTLGCRVNQYETEAMTELFKKAGYSIVDFDEESDVYVINTCTVTSFGDKKSRQMIRKARRKNEDAIIAVVGCYSQVSPDSVAKISGVNIILGTNDRKRIVDFVEKYLNNREQNQKSISYVDNIMNIRKFEELEIDNYRDKTRAFLKVQDGCNRFCSYCLIPYARGPIRSRNPEGIIEEVKKLSETGFKEIILSGIHVASYGKDLKDGGNITLTDIIEQINCIAGIERIRIGSVEPTFFTDDTIKRLSKVEKLCRHFHLSLQSGNDETLKRMNRKYTIAEYENIVNKLRDYFPGVSITTDVIVGFPGETKEEFNSTYEFLKKMELSKMHIFKYSKREGTPAAKFENQVDYIEKERRSNLLIELNLVNEKKFIDRFIGQSLKVLYEQECNNMEGFMEGYTDNYINVKTKGSADMIGNIYNTILVENSGEFAIGRI